jgi:hypothetical protein
MGTDRGGSRQTGRDGRGCVVKERERQGADERLGKTGALALRGEREIRFSLGESNHWEGSLP